MLRIRALQTLRSIRITLRRLNHHPNHQPVFLRELKVAFVVRRHAHQRARSIFRENKISDPDRNLLARKRIHGKSPRKESFLLRGRNFLGLQNALAQLVPLLFDSRGAGHSSQQFANQRMSGRKHNRRRAENRVDARGENLNGSAFHLRHVEFDSRSLRFADPIALHRQDALRPAAFDLLHVVEKLIRIRRNFPEPLRDLARLHDRALMAPATTVDHLLVRQHSLAFRTPIHAALFPIGDSLLQHPEEKPLIPAIVFRLAGGNFLAPVVAEAESAQDFLEFGDVLARPVTRTNAPVNRRVLRGQSKRVPTHRMEHIESAHPAVPCHCVADGVIAHVAHVHRAGGIRQHLEHVEFRARRIGIRQERVLLVPDFLPLGFNRACVVLAQCHCPRPKRFQLPKLRMLQIRAGLKAAATIAVT